MALSVGLEDYYQSFPRKGVLEVSKSLKAILDPLTCYGQKLQTVLMRSTEVHVAWLEHYSRGSDDNTVKATGTKQETQRWYTSEISDQQVFCGYVLFVNRSSLGGHMLQTTTAQVCYHNTKAAVDQMQSK